MIGFKKLLTIPKQTFNFTGSGIYNHLQRRSICQMKPQSHQWRYPLTYVSNQTEMFRRFGVQLNSRQNKITSEQFFGLKLAPNEMKNLQHRNSWSKQGKSNIFRQIMQLISKLLGSGCLLYIITKRKDPLMLSDPSTPPKPLLNGEKIQKNILQKQEEYQDLHESIYLWLLADFFFIVVNIILALLSHQASIATVIWRAIQGYWCYSIMKKLNLKKKLVEEIALLAKIQNKL